MKMILVALMAMSAGTLAAAKDTYKGASKGEQSPYSSGYSQSPGMGSSSRSHTVSGHTRRDGAYVQPHVRTNQDSSRNNNWSTQGNVNPHTGESGTKPRSRY